MRYLSESGKISPSKADEMAVEAQPTSKKRRVSVCVGCGSQILDQYIMRVAPDLEWHADCLKCADCEQYLDETCTCYVRDGKTYCKRDYLRLFGTKCSGCLQCFGTTEFVMRAKNKVFHVDCFRCIVCNKPLTPGEEFALREDRFLYCKLDNESQERPFSPSCQDIGSPGSAGGGSSTPNSAVITVNNNNASAVNNNNTTSTTSSGGGGGGGGGGNNNSNNNSGASVGRESKDGEVITKRQNARGVAQLCVCREEPHNETRKTTTYSRQQEF
ncbi:hypothetical protein ACOMHN_064238 [Nucella lapillus]